MLKPVQLYVEEVSKLFWEIAYDEHYMFVNDGYTQDYKASIDTWSEHEFVSVSKDNKVLGYIRYSINQRSQIVTGFAAVNFSNSLTFARDLFQAIDDIFYKYGYRKLKYGVFIGNPIEKTYDRLTKKFGGRIIGISEKDVRLLDGQFYDHKTYEIFRDNYIKNRKG